MKRLILLTIICLLTSTLHQNTDITVDRDFNKEVNESFAELDTTEWMSDTENLKALKSDDETVKNKIYSKFLTTYAESIVDTVTTENTQNKDYNSITISESNNTDYVASLANDIWNTQVPDDIKVKFVNSGWKIVISDQSLKNRFGYGSSIAGVTYFNEHTIYLDNRKVCPSRALIHEIGHYIDYTNNWPSMTKEFADIFESEKRSFIDCTSVGDGHETSSVEEYFASVWQNALVNRERCRQQVPKSYEFVCRYMQ